MAFPKIKLSNNDGRTVDVTENNELKVKLSDSVTVTATDLSVALNALSDSVECKQPDETLLKATVTQAGNVNIGTMPGVDAIAVGLDAENAAITGKPILIGGRYDSSSRSLDDGDIGGIAVTSKGYLITEDQALGNALLTDDSAYSLGTGKGIMMMGYAGGQAIGINSVGALSCTPEGFLNVAISGQTPLGELLTKSEAVAGTDTYTETSTIVSVAGAIRNDDVASLADTDNEVAPLQVNRAGSLYVHQEAATSITTYSEITVGTSAATLASLSTAETECKGVVIQAQTGNTGHVMVGDLGVTASSEGIAIYPGDTMTLNVKSTLTIVLRASNATEKINVMVLQ